MSRTRAVLGLVSSILLVASGVAHSVLGWPGLLRSVTSYRIDPAVLNGLQVPWNMAAVGMAGFGLIGLVHFVAMWKGRERDPIPARIVGGLFGAFGLWALAFVARDPFFLSFVLPGAGIALSAGRSSPRRTTSDTE